MRTLTTKAITFTAITKQSVDAIFSILDSSSPISILNQGSNLDMESSYLLRETITYTSTCIVFSSPLSMDSASSTLHTGCFAHPPPNRGKHHPHPKRTACPPISAWRLFIYPEALFFPIPPTHQPYSITFQNSEPRSDR